MRSIGPDFTRVRPGFFALLLPTALLASADLTAQSSHEPRQGVVEACRRVQSIDILCASSAISTAAEADTQTSSAPESQRTGLYGSATVGMFFPIGTNGKLETVDTGYGWGLSLGYRIISWLGLEGEFLYFQGDYEGLSDTLLPGTADNEINMASVALSMRLRASYPLWKLRPFVGGGVSFFDSDLYTKQASSGLFENAAGNQAAGWQALAGVGLPAVKQWHAELAWRWIHLCQDFGVFSIGKVQLGGNMLYIGISGGY